LSVEKSPAWVRFAQIGLGIIVVILSIYALSYPGAAFVSIVLILGIILFIVGIEKIIAGIFLPIKGKGASIGLGILVLIFAGLVIAYPGFATWIITVFLGIALLFGGGASIAQESFPFWSRHIVNNYRNHSPCVSCLWCTICRICRSNRTTDSRNSDDRSRCHRQKTALSV